MATKLPDTIYFNTNTYNPALNNKINKVAIMNTNQMYIIHNQITGGSVQDWLTGGFYKSINALIFFPFTISGVITDNMTFIRGYNESTHQTEGEGLIIGNTSTGINAYDCTGDITMYTFYSDTPIQAKYHNFLDNDNYTKYTLILPMTEPIELPNDVFEGKRLVIKYSIGRSDGTLTWYIFEEHRYNEVDYLVLIITKTIKVGVQIPIGQSNSMEVLNNKLQSAIQLGLSSIGMALGVASGNAIMSGGSLMGVIKSGTQMASSMIKKPQISSSSINNKDMYHQHSQALLISDKPIVRVLDDTTQKANYYKVNGYPTTSSFTGAELRNLANTKQRAIKIWIEDIHLNFDNVLLEYSGNLTEEEQSELRNILLSNEGIIYRNS